MLCCCVRVGERENTLVLKIHLERVTLFKAVHNKANFLAETEFKLHEAGYLLVSPLRLISGHFIPKPTDHHIICAFNRNPGGAGDG